MTTAMLACDAKSNGKIGQYRKTGYGMQVWRGPERKQSQLIARLYRYYLFMDRSSVITVILADLDGY